MPRAKDPESRGWQGLAAIKRLLTARLVLPGWTAPIGAVALVLGFCLLLLHRDPGFFWNDDYQVYHLPAMRDIARAWESGEVPLLSPSSWYGGALAGELQHGTFSIFTNLVVVLIWKLGLTLPATAALFSMIHLAVLAAGAFCLARQRRLPGDLATLVAIVACLNGWIVCWAASDWVSTLVSFAWVPWAWWALEWALIRDRGAARFLPAGFFLYLILAAGWPFSILMIGLVTAFLLLRAAFEQRRSRDLWPVVAAWAWGVALAAPALLVFASHLGSGLRSGHQGLQWSWVVPPTAIAGLLFPYYPTTWIGFESAAELRPAIELTCGFLPPVLLAAAIVRLRRAFLHAFRWDLALLALTLALAVLPSVAPLRFSYRWLPLFHLVLGLLAAQALASLRAADAAAAADPQAAAARFSSFAVVATALGFLILETVLILAFYSLFVFIDSGFQVVLVALALLLAYPAWVWFRRIAATADSLRRWLPCLVVLLSLWTTYSHVPTRYVKRWEFPEALRQAEPLDPAVRYLSVYSRDEAYRSDPELALLIRPGNTAMLSGVQVVNGYSPLQPAGLGRVLGMRSHLGFSYEVFARRILENETGRDGLLELMGVDGLVLSSSWRDHAEALQGMGWETVHSSAAGVVLHRIGRRGWEARSLRSVAIVSVPEAIPKRISGRGSAAVPRLLARPDPPPAGTVEYSLCELETTRSSRLGVEVRVAATSAEHRCLVVFARPWYPGYRATLDGRPLRVEALNLVLPAVELPAGAQGRLVLEYAPAAMRIGLAVSLLALLTGAGIAAMGALRRRSC